MFVEFRILIQLKDFTVEKKILINKSKSANWYFLLASMQGFQATGTEEAFSPPKRTFCANEISSLLFLRCGGRGDHLSLVGYGMDPTEAGSNPDTDPNPRARRFTD
jgi:hypothetical protein